MEVVVRQYANVGGSDRGEDSLKGISFTGADAELVMKLALAVSAVAHLESRGLIDADGFVALDRREVDKPSGEGAQGSPA